MGRGLCSIYWIQVAVNRPEVAAWKRNLRPGDQLNGFLKCNRDEYSTVDHIRTDHIAPTGVANRNNRAKNWVKAMTTKYSVASCRMTFQRVFIPRDLSGNALLALKAMIKKAKISIISWRGGCRTRAPKIEVVREEHTESKCYIDKHERARFPPFVSAQPE